MQQLKNVSRAYSAQQHLLYIGLGCNLLQIPIVMIIIIIYNSSYVVGLLTGPNFYAVSLKVLQAHKYCAGMGQLMVV